MSCNSHKWKYYVSMITSEVLSIDFQSSCWNLQHDNNEQKEKQITKHSLRQPDQLKYLHIKSLNIISLKGMCTSQDSLKIFFFPKNFGNMAHTHKIGEFQQCFVKTGKKMHDCNFAVDYIIQNINVLDGNFKHLNTVLLLMMFKDFRSFYFCNFQLELFFCE